MLFSGGGGSGPSSTSGEQNSPLMEQSSLYEIMNRRENTDNYVYPASDTEAGVKKVIAMTASQSARIKRLADECNLPYPVVAATLANKTLREFSDEELKRYIIPDIEEKHPLELCDSAKQAYTVLEDAINNGEKIGIYGDYDADGVTSAVLMHDMVADYMADVDNAIVEFSNPVDGFCFSEKGLDKLMAEGCKTIVVLDTGSDSIDVLEKAINNGIKVVVLDHHAPDRGLVDGVTYVNPHLEDSVENPEELRNASYTWYFGRGFHEHMGNAVPEDYSQYGLGIAAIGHMADAGSRNEGTFAAAIAVNGLSEGPMSMNGGFLDMMGIKDAKTVISAAHLDLDRLSIAKRNADISAKVSYNVLSRYTSEDERQKAIKTIMDAESDITQKTNDGAKFAISTYTNEDVFTPLIPSSIIPPANIGMAGKLAGKLAGGTGVNRPTVAFVPDADGSLKGSWRIGSSHLDGRDMLASISNPDYQKKVVGREFSVEGGGHIAAGGFSIDKNDYADTCKLISSYVAEKKVGDESYIPKNVPKKERDNVNQWATCVVNPNDITKRLASQMRTSGPWSFWDGGTKPPGIFTQNLVFGGFDSRHSVGQFIKPNGETIEARISKRNVPTNPQPGEIVDVIFAINGYDGPDFDVKFIG